MARGTPNQSDDVSSTNFLDLACQCQSYADSLDWANFDPLYFRLAKFVDEDDGAIQFEDQWKKFRDAIIEALVRRLEAASTISDYQEGLERLKDVLNDPQTLWSVIHTKLTPTLKVTLNECRLLARNSFTPIQLFEFGFAAFSECSLCDMKTVNNDEALIDVFYAVAGFVSACDLPANYSTRLPCYLSFLSSMLEHFMNLPDFDPHRLVWLIEMINIHLHIASHPFMELCESLIRRFAEADNESSLMNKLHKLCVISTSPVLGAVASIHDSIDTMFDQVVDEQREFVRKYIFPSFAIADWLGVGGGDAYAAWRLWLTNFIQRMNDRVELPRSLLAGVVEDLLDLFVGYYGGLQPARRPAVEMRAEIFGIISVIVEVIPQVSDEMMRQLHRLLLFAALSGMIPEEIPTCSPGPVTLGMALADPFLGLAISGADFVDYRTAIRRLSVRFEEDDFVTMARSMRQNYGLSEDD
jgi:AcrR family transcriptional regulator